MCGLACDQPWRMLHTLLRRICILLLLDRMLYKYQLKASGLVVVHSLSRVQLCDPMDCNTAGFLPFIISRSLLKLMTIEVGDAIQPSCPLPPPSPALSLSQYQGLFQWVSSLHQVTKVLELQLQHSSSSKYSGLISFRMDWFDFLAVQGTLRSSPEPRFESISSSALSLLYGPTLKSVYDYWKNHSFDYMDLCQQSDVSDF